jgi:hypothetical protein
MIWKTVHWSVHLFFWIALAVVLASAFYNPRPAKVHATGKVEFHPMWLGVLAWTYVAARMCFIAAGYLRHGLGEPLTGALLGLGSVGSIFMLPGTVLLTDSGLQEVFWLWRNTRIRWDEIVEINTEKKDSAVTVIGADKTRIIHSGRLPDRPRFLLEIKRHCGENLPADFPGRDVNNSSA